MQKTAHMDEDVKNLEKMPKYWLSLQGVSWTLLGLSNISRVMELSSQSKHNEKEECYSHLSNQYERYESQYTFLKLLESDNTNFTKSIFMMILRPHWGLFE